MSYPDREALIAEEAASWRGREAEAARLARLHETVVAAGSPIHPEAPGGNELGRKDDLAKPRWTLLPWDALRAVVGVLEYGAQKYAPQGWRTVTDPVPRYRDALVRHLVAQMDGEDIDPESGHHHAAHVATNALFLLWFALRGVL